MKRSICVLVLGLSAFGVRGESSPSTGDWQRASHILNRLAFGPRPGDVEAGQLFENRDLAVTTDFSDIFGELLRKQLGVADLKPVFPGYDVTTSRWRNVLA